jgi:acetoin utilization deacetylase AcuC-like enzyme
MAKYELLPEQLRYEGTLTEAHFFEPGSLPEDRIVRVHSSDYWDKLRTGTLSPSEERRTGFPFSHALVARERTIMQGTVECTSFAKSYGVAMNIAGGTHHAYADHGEGFCLLNDLALGAQHVLDTAMAKRVLIIDLDVHQGNGTAALFANDDRVFTFSMHGEKNYPMKKEKSDLDVGLADGCTDAAYLAQLCASLPRIIDAFEPDFAFFQTGVDVLEEDKLGRLSLSLYGCKERDRIVFEHCKRNAIPVVSAMGGGYSPNIKTIVEAHANTFRLAQEIYF